MAALHVPITHCVYSNQIWNSIFLIPMADPGTSSKQSTFTEWVEQYSADMYAYALRRMPDESLAEDVVQTTFMAALKSFDTFKGDSSPKTWLMSILKNKIMDHYRSAYRRNETSLDTTESMFNADGTWKETAMPADWGDMNVLDNTQFRAVFYECLENLPEHWNAAVKIKYLESAMDPEDLGLSKANYWKILERARKQLRTCLEMNWFNVA